MKEMTLIKHTRLNETNPLEFVTDFDFMQGSQDSIEVTNKMAEFIRFLDSLQTSQEKETGTAGSVATFTSWTSVEEHLPQLVQRVKGIDTTPGTYTRYFLALAVLLDQQHVADEDDILDQCAKFMESQKSVWEHSDIQRIIFVLVPRSASPLVTSFIAGHKPCEDGSVKYVEDHLCRNLQPNMEVLLDLKQLKLKKNISVVNTKCDNACLFAEKTDDGRVTLYARAAVRRPELITQLTTHEFFQSETERLLLECTDSLFFGRNHFGENMIDSCHIFLHIVPVIEDTEAKMKRKVERYLTMYLKWLQKLCVTEVETVTRLKQQCSDKSATYRIFVKIVAEQVCMTVQKEEDSSGKEDEDSTRSNGEACRGE